MKGDKYFYGYILLPNNKLERLILEFSDDSLITIRGYSNKYFGASYSEEKANYIVAHSSISKGEFLCCIFNDIVEEDILIGAWAAYSHLNDNDCLRGKIILEYIGKVDLNDISIPQIFDTRDNDVFDEVQDILVIEALKKYFGVRPLSKDKQKNVEVLMDKIENLREQMSLKFDVISLEQNQISKDIQSLKEKLYTEDKKHNYLIDLKMLVGRGEIKQVLDSIQNNLKSINKELLNDYILIYSSYSKLEQDSLKGLISFENSNIERNRINKSLLDFLDTLFEPK